MPRPAARDQPSDEETAALVADLHASVEAARVRPVRESKFTARGGQVWNTARTRYARVEIGDPNTTLLAVEAATSEEIDRWTEPTDLLLHRLQASGVDYDAIVDVGH